MAKSTAWGWIALCHILISSGYFSLCSLSLFNHWGGADLFFRVLLAIAQLCHFVLSLLLDVKKGKLKHSLIAGVIIILSWIFMVNYLNWIRSITF